MQQSENLPKAGSPPFKGQFFSWPKHLLIIGGIILAIAILIGLNIYRINQKEGVPVKVVEVKEAPIKATVYTSGKVTVPQREEIISINGGLIRKVAVKRGEIVSAGQVLVELEDEEQALAVRQAEANLALAQANLNRTLEDTAPNEIARAEDTVRQAQANLENIQQRLERTQSLFEQGIVSRQELEALELEEKLKQSQYDTAVRMLETTPKGVLANRKALEAQVAQAEAALTLAQKRWEQTVLRASRDGQVLQLEVEPSEYVVPGKIVAVVGQTEQLEVKADLSEMEAAQVQVGQEVEITTEAVSKTRYMGEVIEVAPQAITRPTSQGEQTLVPVVIAVKGENALRPGYNVDLSIITGQAEAALVIPFETLIETDEKTEVWVVQDGVAHYREVTTGLTDDLQVQILNGLQVGDSVIINPADDLTEGTEVKIIGLEREEKGKNHD